MALSACQLTLKNIDEALKQIGVDEFVYVEFNKGRGITSYLLSRHPRSLTIKMKQGDV